MKPTTTYPVCNNPFPISSINEDMKLGQVSLYPNPVNTVLVVSPGQRLASGTVEVFDINGKTVLSENFHGEEQLTLDVGHLQPGIYMCRIKTKKNISGSSKFLKL